MAAMKNLLIAPSQPLDAFAATGVLADLLQAEPHNRVDIMCRASDVVFFQDAPGVLKFHTYADIGGPGPGFMLRAMGQVWHRIVALVPVRLPFLLWAQHRHVFRFEPGAYALPSLYRPDLSAPPTVWMPDKLHLALPETLAPTAPLIVLATGESRRADWDWRSYAELAWRLADRLPALQKAHIVVLATADCPIADGLMDSIPAGQISRFDDLPYAKQAAMMRRAVATVGTDRLAARMAPYAGCRLVLRLDRSETDQPGRPYGLYVGHDPAEVAAYIDASLAKTATAEDGSAKTSKLHR